MKEKLSFQVDGEFLCTTARSWFWEEGRPYEQCERLLLGGLITDQLTLTERKRIAIEILEGRKKLVGINSFHLAEDSEHIRPLTLKFQQYERQDMIRRIQADMEARPLAYVDRYAAPRPLEDYEAIWRWQRGEEPNPGAVLTPADQVRMYLYAQTNYIGATRLESEYYDGEKPLDRGCYLFGHPDWVNDFIGAPVSEENEDALYQKLYEFWSAKSKENRPMTQLTFIRARNERYLAAMRAGLSLDERDELLHRTEPDGFLSEYGMIDRQGRWYSCPFGGHNAKAYTLARAKPEQFGFHPGERIPHRDKALDLLFDAGWVILQNPYISGEPSVVFKSGLRPTKAQVDTVFDYMIHFNRHKLAGIERIL